MKQRSEMALAVLMITSLSTTEKDSVVRISDPVGPRLLRRGDGPYRVGGIPILHRGFRRMMERSDPGAYGFMNIRVRYVDDIVESELNAGVAQLVILGAGYDTRAYRMPQLRSVPVFEVDVPEMSLDKRDRLGDALGEVPSNVRFVEADFNNDGLPVRLAEHGFDPTLPTLFLLIGVSMYLPEEAMREVLSDALAFENVRTSIVFDYLYPDALTRPQQYRGAEQWVKRARAAGEHPNWGIWPSDLPGFLRSCGGALDSDFRVPDLAPRYLRRSNGSAIPEPWDFANIAHGRVAEFS